MSLTTPHPHRFDGDGRLATTHDWRYPNPTEPPYLGKRLRLDTNRAFIFPIFFSPPADNEEGNSYWDSLDGLEDYPNTESGDYRVSLIRFLPSYPLRPFVLTIHSLPSFLAFSLSPHFLRWKETALTSPTSTALTPSATRSPTLRPLPRLRARLRFLTSSWSSVSFW